MFILYQGAAAFPGLGPRFLTRQHVPQTYILWDRQRMCVERFSKEDYQGKKVEVPLHRSMPGHCVGADVVVSLPALWCFPH